MATTDEDGPGPIWRVHRRPDHNNVAGQAGFRPFSVTQLRIRNGSSCPSAGVAAGLRGRATASSYSNQFLFIVRFVALNALSRGADNP